MYVYERMTPNASFVSLNTKITDTLDLIKKCGHTRLPVTDDKGRVAGLISNDMISSAQLERRILNNTKVIDIMQHGILRINENNLIEYAAIFMKENRIDFLPVIDNSEKLAGVLTLSDLISAFVTITGVKENGTRIVIKGDNCLERVSDAIDCIHSCGETISFVSAHKSKSGESVIVIKIGETAPENVIFKLESKGFKVDKAKKEHS